MVNKFLAAVVTAAAISGLSACGSGSQASSDPTAGMASSESSATANVSIAVNDADVSFASDMIQHHRQALEMAKLGQARAANAKVKQLAVQIEAAQGPEIATMSTWLGSLGKPVPDEMSGMDMGGSMPGMMSTSQMQDLANATGTGFDRMFLRMMIAHHEGAVTMAKTEESNGSNPDVKALARSIATAQTAEIATMKTILG